jgi:hypothetical protein
MSSNGKSNTNQSDIRLERYRSYLNRPIITEVRLEHIFLDLKEEGKLEQTAIFSRPNNMKTINLLLSHFELERLGENVVIVSMTSHSTQVYHRGGVLGAFYMGSAAIIDNPSLVLQMIRQILSAARAQGLHIPIVFCNHIGKFVNQSINLLRETTESVEKMINTDALDLAFKSRDQGKISLEEKRFAAVWMLLTLMMQEAVATDAQIILKSHKKPTLDYDWIHEKVKIHAERLPNGVYVVDFSSDAITIYFFDPSRSELTILSKEMTYISGENNLISLMKAGNVTDTQTFNRFVGFIRDKVTIHALTNSIYPIVCHIIQTGPMRQQHFLGDFTPHVELIL